MKFLVPDPKEGFPRATAPCTMEENTKMQYTEKRPFSNYSQMQKFRE